MDKKTLHAALPFASLLTTVAIASALFAGCESSDDSSGDYWNTKTKGGNSSTTTTTTTTPTTTTSTAKEESAPAAQASGDAAVGGAADQADPGAFSWRYGGFNGRGAAKTSVSIGGLRMSSTSLSYSWTGDTLAAWGLSDDNAGAIACLFLQHEDGSWVGGKFDWISTSRRSRPLENVLGGYAGWTLAGVPNPCNCAFVIVSENGKKRSNVITGTWHR
jgi:hypothetical protein